MLQENANKAQMLEGFVARPETRGWEGALDAKAKIAFRVIFTVRNNRK